MKTIGKALMGSVSMLGSQGGYAGADTWNTFDKRTTTIEGGQWSWSDTPLTLEKSLTLKKNVIFAVANGFSSKDRLFMETESAIFTKGAFYAASIELVSLGRVSPRPPIPTPKLPQGIEAFNTAFFDALEDKEIRFGAGIFATEEIKIDALDLHFSGDYMPVHGDKFLVAATTRLKGISPKINLTSNLDPSRFKAACADLPLDVNGQEYQYAHVTVSAV
jgi:hypothetical protein